jgi:hypothetical protein
LYYIVQYYELDQRCTGAKIQGRLAWPRPGDTADAAGAHIVLGEIRFHRLFHQHFGDSRRVAVRQSGP